VDLFILFLYTHLFKKDKNQETILKEKETKMTTVFNSWTDDFTGDVLDMEIYQTNIVPMEIGEEDYTDMIYYGSIANDLEE
jgi:hypothetical protein